ncbi:MAG: adenylate/guanylate cyclase [Leptospirales bacterium]|nr:adenylate/guanylate cyclase [Leptospirales bacterium]
MKPATSALLSLALVCLLPSAVSTAPETIAEDAVQGRPLGKELEVLEDPSGALGIDEIAGRQQGWRSSAEDYPGFQFSSSAFWVRLRLENSASAPRDVLLEQGYPLIDSLSLFLHKDGSWRNQEFGDHLPFAQRPIEHRNFVMPIRLAPGMNEIYLRYQTSSKVSVHLRLWSPQAFLEGAIHEQMALGLYYGIILVMLVYNFFLFVSLRDLSYLYYVAFIAGFGLYQSTLNGLTFQYLWPNAVWWGNASLPFFMFLGVAAAKLFTRSLLNTRRYARWLDHLLRGLIVVSAALAPISLLLTYRLGIAVAIGMVGISVLLMMCAGILTAWRRFPPAYYYLAAWTTLLLGVLAYIGQTAGVLPDNAITSWSQQVGSAVEVVLLSLALGARISVLRESNERAQAALIERQKESLAMQRRMSDSFARFVPRQFLSFLAREAVTEVQLGDQVQREMTILFADIRNFTNLSEQMTPAENFNFLNAYLKRVGPIVRQNNGFIDKYIGDAVMALFPANPDDAVRTAIALQREIREYNRSRLRADFDPIRIGIGIHTGVLTLGVIGEHERVETTVISDAVNLASRIESLTKKSGASILISENTLFGLEDPNAYRLRMLGRVRLKGKKNTIAAFEVFEGQSDYVVDFLQQTRSQFEQGVSEYYAGDYNNAIAHFQRCLESFPNDQAAQVYLNSARRWQRMRSAVAAIS